MIVDIQFVDVLIVFASALSVVLRASRHVSWLPMAPVPTSGRVAPADAIEVVAVPSAATTNGPFSHQRFGWKIPRGIRNVFSRTTEDQRPHHTSVVEGPSSQRHPVGSPPSDPASALYTLAYAANVLALISNCLTHLLRHSQVLYTIFLTMCDALIAGRERPRNRATHMTAFCALLVVLYVLHERTMLFWVGDLCGYVGGLAQLFLLGSTLASRQPPVVLSVSQQHHGTNAVVAEFTLERCAACVSSLCYLAMLLDEGEAVYSCHTEFVRWYVATFALLAIDGIQLQRFVSGKRIIEARE